MFSNLIFVYISDLEIVITGLMPILLFQNDEDVKSVLELITPIFP